MLSHAIVLASSMFDVSSRAKLSVSALAERKIASARPRKYGLLLRAEEEMLLYGQALASQSRAFFVELAGDQFGDRIDGSLRFGADRGDDDRCPRSRGQHHQPHNGGAADRLVAFCHPDFGAEALDRLDEFGGSARVQTALVDDGNFPGYRARRDTWPAIYFGRRVVVGHLPARTRLAMVTYLRPASWAMAMASGSDRSSRTLASLTSMGRLMPASTSTFGRLMQEIAMLERGPPNMSVRIATPSPLSTRLTASM